MKKRGLLYAVLCFLLTLLLSAASLAGANNDCYQVISNAHGAADIPFVHYSGAADVEFDGQVYVADVTVEIQEMTATDDGTYHLEAKTTFTFAALGSTIETWETAVLSPTDEAGVYRVNSRMIINDGTGGFDGVFGKLLPHGYISFIDQEFSVVAKGKACF